MEGVTILSEMMSRDMSIFGCITLICVGSILLVVGIICLVLLIREQEVSPFIILSVILILSGVVLGTFGIVHLSDKPYTVYKVIIDDDVSFKEFNEKYEIIKQDGLIYEVKEK